MVLPVHPGDGAEDEISTCTVAARTARVVASASMSLDGFIAEQDDTIGRLFDRLQNGDVEIPP